MVGDSGAAIMLNSFPPALLKWSGISVELGLLVLQSYLTDVWNLSFTNAAGILNIWGGMSMVLQVFLLFLVDAYLSHFRMLVITSIAYTLGIGLISMSIPPIFASFSDGACKEYDASCIGHTQKCIFYTGMVLVAIGISGHQVSLDPFLEEQKPTRDLGPSVEEINHVPDLDPSVEEQNPWLDLDPSVEEQNPTHDHLDPSPEMQNPTHNNMKLSRWILLIIKQIIIGVLIPVIGTLVLPLKELWWVCFGIPAIGITTSTLLFLSGWCLYTKNNKHEGSPLTNVCRVFVAAASNISQPLPINEVNNEGQGQSTGSSCLPLRCLEKASIDTSSENPQTKSRWKHCSVTEVEEAKTAVRMMPIWMTSIICGVVSSMGKTYFIEQANHLSRDVGNINIPLPVMLLFLTWVKSCSRLEKDDLKESDSGALYESGIGVLASILFSIGCCVAAGGVETRRLSVIKKHALLDKPDEDIPMSIFWLVFQFYSLGCVEYFYEKGLSELYEKETPKSMKNYILCFIKGVTGLGFMFGVFLVYVVGQVSESGGKPNWFQFTLNRSRLDLYYWTLAVLCLLNFYLLHAVVAIIGFNKPIERRSSDDGDDRESHISNIEL